MRDIGEWMRIPCTITAGKDEKSAPSDRSSTKCLARPSCRTYTQPVREGRPYDLCHGTLEARPVTATTSKLVYTLMFDNSMLADDAARERNKAQRTATFTTALENMKTLAEGGTLAPAATARRRRRTRTRKLRFHQRICNRVTNRHT